MDTVVIQVKCSADLLTSSLLTWGDPMEEGSTSCGESSKDCTSSPSAEWVLVNQEV